MIKKPVTKRKQPTMYDVAKLAGVSQPTVSRVLNRTETTAQISEDTLNRVLLAVKKLGYRPNTVARSLRTQRTQTIAVMIADLGNSFYHPIVRTIQEIARQHDYEIVISNSDHVYENEKHFCEIVLGRGVDGVIMVPLHLTNAEMGHYVEQTHIPFVVLGAQIDHPNIDVVYVDDERATYEATRWLIAQCGHRSLGYIGVTTDLPPGPRRLRGFNRALGDFDLTLNPDHFVAGDFSLESGKRAVQTLLRRGKLPTALMVVNDLMAIGVILALQEAGYSVPKDVAVIGFDDILEAIIVRPTLSTIAQNPHEIGAKLARALFERLEDPTINARRVFESSYKFIPRQST
ncbi:MAG: LacI family DNA-binding transcriptional regulator [Chloroflexota bacterium]